MSIIYFTKRGEAGIDVRFIDSEGSIHPSQYEVNPMNWPEGLNHGDFKPGTISGYNQFLKDINSGKFPMDSVYLPYDPETGELILKQTGEGIGIEFKY